MTPRPNPLLEAWSTPFGVPPFDRIESADYLPALRDGIGAQRQEIDRIRSAAEAPSFANTIEALERSGRRLRRVSQAFFAVESAHTDDTLQAAARAIAPELARHHDAIHLDRSLFARVRAVFEQRDALGLDDEARRLLEETHKTFVRSGAALEDVAQERLRAINEELATLTQVFGENLLAETNDFDLHVDDQSDLGELPADLATAAAAEARRRGHAGGWSFTLQRSSIEPFLECSPNRTLRRRILDGYARRGARGNVHDNTDLVRRIVSLRAERAQLLGAASHAHHTLDDSMARTPERVQALLGAVLDAAKPIAERDRATLQRALEDDGITATLEASDWPYYAARQRRARFDLDPQATRPYFELGAVRDGCFAVAERLFGLRVRRVDHVPTWHCDQQAFEVRDQSDEHVGVLLMDFFARPTKRAGAWMTELREQSRLWGEDHPVVTNTFNFAPPSADTPALLSFDEAATLFHEFGHALHALLSDVRYASLAGTNVPRDFVEFPSQLLENWLLQPEVLRSFARHHQSDEPLPEEWIERIRGAARFDQGYQTMEYLAAAQLDLAWHLLDRRAAEGVDVAAFEAAVMRGIGLPDAILPRYRSTYFAHVFAGGYAAGYYSYVWSEVLDADAFAAFEESGLFDPGTAERLRRVLSRGNTVPGMELYRAFRGREPRIEPLLVRRGLVEERS